jgi:Co/Zn/Cd efflux system component
MTLALAILKAIATIPTLKKIMDQAIAVYISHLDAQESMRITKAARDLRLAKTKEEMQDALRKWLDAAK